MPLLKKFSHYIKRSLPVANCTAFIDLKKKKKNLGLCLQSTECNLSNHFSLPLDCRHDYYYINSKNTHWRTASPLHKKSKTVSWFIVTQHQSIQTSHKKNKKSKSLYLWLLISRMIYIKRNQSINFVLSTHSFILTIFSFIRKLFIIEFIHKSWKCWKSFRHRVNENVSHSTSYVYQWQSDALHQM